MNYRENWVSQNFEDLGVNSLAQGLIGKTALLTLEFEPTPF